MDLALTSEATVHGARGLFCVVISGTMVFFESALAGEVVAGAPRFWNSLGPAETGDLAQCSLNLWKSKTRYQDFGITAFLFWKYYRKVV